MTSPVLNGLQQAQRRPRADGERTRSAVLREAASPATVDGLDGLSIGNLATEAPPGPRARAYVTFLMFNDSYLPGCLLATYGLQRQRSRADLVCVVTTDVCERARAALRLRSGVHPHPSASGAWGYMAPSNWFGACLERGGHAFRLPPARVRR
jgi:hypothetical protein